MKVNHYLYPHPVLGIGEDYQEVPETTFKISYDEVTGMLSFQFEVVGLSSDFKDLLIGNQMALICEVNCSYTLYRKVFSTFEEILIFEISEDELKDKVALQLMLLAVVDIENFYSNNFSPDLQFQPFQIEKGDILGILNTTSIDIDAAELAISDFVKISENTVDEYTRYELDQNALTIKLPPIQLQSLQLLKNNINFENTLISTIIIPALIHALHYLSEENDELYGGKAWFRALKEKSEAIIGQPYPSDPGDITVLIDRILEKPNERLFKELEKINH
jgi:hypothetical protein